MALKYALVSSLGDERVFFDTHVIGEGVNFRRATTAAVRAARVVLVVIGQQWLMTGESGKLRLEEPDDDVRREINVASRNGKKIVPVLVDEATMPTVAQLQPIGLGWLASLNAFKLHHETFERDAETLAERVK